MNYKHSFTLLCGLTLLAMSALVPTRLLARSGGPPDNKTNAPGQGVCTDSGCHTSNPQLNSGGGSFQISGVPTAYAPETPYTITVTINQTGQMRWGFELAALKSDGKQGGTIAATDALTQTSTTGGVTFIKHTSLGTRAGQPGPTSWSFTWTSPADDAGAITFYAAGNAANNNGSNSGDFIYTATAQTAPAPTSIHEIEGTATRYELFGNRPNPFNPTTTITFSVPRRGYVTLATYSITGQRVKTLAGRSFAPGRYAVTWNGTDDTGLKVASGAYLVVLKAHGVVKTRTILLSR